MSETITCPSGLAGQIRGLKVREEKVLTSRQLARQGHQFDRLLEACWESTLDPGPYTFDADAPDWGSVLQGDRFFILLQLRVLTYGPEYAFRVGCSNPACGARFEWTVNVNELATHPLADEHRQSFIQGNRFETGLLSDGRKVFFRLLTGADEHKLSLMQRQSRDQALSNMLRLRIHEIEHVSRHDLRAFIDDLSLRDVNALIEAFDEVDCGVDTMITIECPECFTLQEIDLPFGEAFFFPAAKTARNKKRALRQRRGSTRSGRRSSSKTG